MTEYAVEIVPWAEYAPSLSVIRDQVFIIEQAVPEELERDPLDITYIHALATTTDGLPIGTGRLVTGGKIGRMAVLKPWRGKGVGKALLQALIREAVQQGLSVVSLDSQIHARRFYETMGFTAYGKAFMDAGIPHIKMQKTL